MTHFTKEEISTALSQTQKWLAEARWDRRYAQDETKRLRGRLDVLEQALRDCLVVLSAEDVADGEVGFERPLTAHIRSLLEGGESDTIGNLAAALRELLEDIEDGWRCEPIHWRDCTREACVYSSPIARTKRALGDLPVDDGDRGKKSEVLPTPASKDVTS